jgi:hypothetical protein
MIMPDELLHRDRDCRIGFNLSTDRDAAVFRPLSMKVLSGWPIGPISSSGLLSFLSVWPNTFR